MKYHSLKLILLLRSIICVVNYVARYWNVVQVFQDQHKHSPRLFSDWIRPSKLQNSVNEFCRCSLKYYLWIGTLEPHAVWMAKKCQRESFKWSLWFLVRNWLNSHKHETFKYQTVIFGKVIHVFLPKFWALNLNLCWCDMQFTPFSAMFDFDLSSSKKFSSIFW